MKQIEAGDLVVIVPFTHTEMKVTAVRARSEPSYSLSTILKEGWGVEMARKALNREYDAVYFYGGKSAVVVSVDEQSYALLAVEGELVHIQTRHLQVPLELEITV